MHIRELDIGNQQLTQAYKYIQFQRLYMETKVPEKPVCPICKRKTIYFRANGTVKCRGCGYDGKLEGDLK